MTSVTVSDTEVRFINSRRRRSIGDAPAPAERVNHHLPHPCPSWVKGGRDPLETGCQSRKPFQSSKPFPEQKAFSESKPCTTGSGCTPQPVPHLLNQVSAPALSRS